MSGPVHINRVLREAGHLAVREELGRGAVERAGASEAFAVADHQIAHVYVKSPDRIPEVKRLLESVAGIELALDADGKRRHGLDHSRSGELVALYAAGPVVHLLLLAMTTTESAGLLRAPWTFIVSPATTRSRLFIDPALRLPEIPHRPSACCEEAGVPYAHGRDRVGCHASQRVAWARDGQGGTRALVYHLGRELPAAQRGGCDGRQDADSAPCVRRSGSRNEPVSQTREESPTDSHDCKPEAACQRNQ